MKLKLKNNLFLAGIALLIIILDQLSKFLVRQNLASGESWLPIPSLAPFLQIVNWHNTGAAFGIFQSGNTILKIFTSVIAVVIVIYYQQIPASQKLARVSMSMMVGGALGNLIDRFTQGFVTDFISVGSFPVFNVADSCVTVGVGLLILAMLIQENKDRKALNSDQTGAEESGEPSRQGPVE
ncbi:MAG: signal peptidase II [Anaerolineaceae bacterium]